MEETKQFKLLANERLTHDGIGSVFRDWLATVSKNTVVTTSFRTHLQSENILNRNYTKRMVLRRNYINEKTRDELVVLIEGVRRSIIETHFGLYDDDSTFPNIEAIVCDENDHVKVWNLNKLVSIRDMLMDITNEHGW